MAELEAVVDIEFAKITAEVLCRYEDHVIKMKEWYQDVGAIREMVVAAVEEVAEEEVGLELDDMGFQQVQIPLRMQYIPDTCATYGRRTEIWKRRVPYIRDFQLVGAGYVVDRRHDTYATYSPRPRSSRQIVLIQPLRPRWIWVLVARHVGQVAADSDYRWL